MGLHAIIKGRVQGVGYRHFAQNKAIELGIKGWVRNLKDGDVEAYAEGSLTALNEFQILLKQGPPMAKIEVVSVSEKSMPLTETGFIIRQDG